MIYHLNELLTKMGAPEAREKPRLEWYYFSDAKDGAGSEIAGYADIRFDMGGERLVAELKAPRSEDEIDASPDAATHDRFHMVAERTARPFYFRITEMSFDGEAYTRPSKAIIELGLSLFHAKALDISIRMVEQSFNKEDMLEIKDEDPRKGLRNIPVRRRIEKPAETFGVVIPFRPRQVVAQTGL